MAERLRIALIGCGLISEGHCKVYLEQHERAKVVACCDIDIEKARARAELVGGASATTDFADILADNTIDAVDLCTPPHLHHEAVILAAKAGKHIICQKPLARTIAECDEMIAAAKEAGIILYYAEMSRSNPGAIAIRQAIKDGRIGDLVGIQATFAYRQDGAYLTTAWRYNPEIAGGGQLLDSAIHSIALMHDIGGPSESVSCFTTRFRPELGGDDTSSVIVKFKNGALGTLYSTQATALWFPNPSFTAFGTEGIITLGGRPYSVVLYRPDLPEQSEHLPYEKVNAFQAMINGFLDSVLDGVPILSTAESGREDLRLVLAAYESDRIGKAVSLT